MYSMQGNPPVVQVKEPYSDLDMVTLLAFNLQPRVYKVHLPIIRTKQESGSI